MSQGPLHGFPCTISLYPAAFKVSSISNEGLHYAIKSLVRIHLVKEYRAKQLYLLNKMSCEMDTDVKKAGERYISRKHKVS
jgi:hypothetical protein